MGKITKQELSDTLSTEISDATTNINLLNSGWTQISETWTYASANTIVVPTGATNRYQKSDKIKWTQGTVKYGVIIAVTDTVIAIAINTDYVITNAPISNECISRTDNPVGFPNFFSYIPVVTGYSTLPPASIFIYSVHGKTCDVEINEHTDGISNSIAMTFSLPIPAASMTDATFCWSGIGVGYDNGAIVPSPSFLNVMQGSNIISSRKTFGLTDWTSTGYKRLPYGKISYLI